MVSIMDWKVLRLSIVFAVLLTETTVKCEDTQLIAEADNVSYTQVIHNNPIVIQTQLTNYDEPTLKEYQECNDNAQNCIKVCKGVKDTVACEKLCPICPHLIKEEQVVQGINDTQVVPTKSLNTTNIIRLTNQIHNIIDNSRGNINHNNDNTLLLYQNVSMEGGKFGLGYNNSEPCCIVLREQKNCDRTQFSTASRCHQKRHRVCGEQCKSRVMLAKIITVCDQSDSFDYWEDNCRQSIEYVPYRHRSSSKSMHQCDYIPHWPFVNCPRQHNQRGSSCSGGCLRLSYLHILRNGIPEECRLCFSANGRNMNDGYMSGPPIYPPSYRPYYPPHYAWNPHTPEFDVPINNDYFELDNAGGWNVDKTKCILSDGSISDKCIETDASGANGPVIEDDYNDYDYLNGGSTVRKRRQAFNRSKYSRRYRHREQS